ncbi:MAG: hydantoinase B/oxoprolinase family protein, partial [Armatimonadetes bacterium]|nr:hydantoinase B/oxoprolinase family protein [Armatimonadota bacterium]
AAGNVETSQRIVDTLLKALAPFAPDRVPAASQGTMNNVLIGGWDSIRQRPFAYYETLGGGIGASPKGDGASAMHSHCTNTRNTPIEALETHYPLRVLEYRIADDTGGKGLYRGGNGLIRTIELLSEAHVSLITERRKFPPYGLQGGAEGGKGQNKRQLSGAGIEELPGKYSAPCPAGVTLTVQTPGGGGWGTPKPTPQTE